MKLYRIKLSGRTVIAQKKVIEALLKVRPVPIVNSSYRTFAEQLALFKKGPKVTRTLLSNHRRGSAVDCFANWKEIQDSMRANNMINDVEWDRNHFAYGGERVAAREPIIDNPTIIDYPFNTKKSMQYVIDANNDQWLMYEDPQVAISIANEDDLLKLKAHGLTGEPEHVDEIPSTHLKLASVSYGHAGIFIRDFNEKFNGLLNIH